MSSIQYNLVGSDGVQNLSAVIDGKLYVANSSHPDFNNIVKGVLKGDKSVADLFDATKKVSREFKALSKRVTFDGTTIYFDGDPVDNSITDQILRFMRAGEHFMPLVRFMENIAQNPTEHSRTQLYDWIRGRDFTVTDDGCFLAYKGVRKDFSSVTAGPGIVNNVAQDGHLDNSPGNVLTMARSKVEHNPSVGCANGLHVGAWNYASTFGAVTLVVKVNPRDVVSVPTDCASEKMRVSRYEVLRVAERPSNRPSVDTDDEGEIYQQWEHFSHTQPGVSYTITEYVNGDYECSCPAFKYNDGEPCKHLRKYI